MKGPAQAVFSVCLARGMLTLHSVCCVATVHALRSPRRRSVPSPTSLWPWRTTCASPLAATSTLFTRLSAARRHPLTSVLAFKAYVNAQLRCGYKVFVLVLSHVLTNAHCVWLWCVGALQNSQYFILGNVVQAVSVTASCDLSRESASHSLCHASRSCNHQTHDYRTTTLSWTAPTLRSALRM